MDINDIKNLFYNPENESIEEIIDYMKKTHEKILKLTDVENGVIPLKQFNYKSALEENNISKEPVSRKNLIDKTSKLFEGAVRWHSPKTMFNVTPPPTLFSIAATALTSIYNPNLA